jgi:membrane protein
MASNRFPRLLRILTGAIADADEVLQLEGRLERFVHFWALVTRQFIRHRCLVRASALSYSTLLALIPLLVVALNVTSSLLSPASETELTQFVEKTVASLAPAANIPAGPLLENRNLPLGSATNAAIIVTTAESATNAASVFALTATNPPPATATVNPQTEVARTIHELVQKAGNGTLRALGIILLIFTSISLLRGIEETFNDLWGVTRARHWLVQIPLYWMIISLGPLLLSAALGFPGSAHLQKIRALMESLPFLALVLKHAFSISVLSLALALLYKFTPNTKVEIKAALLGGVCAGAAWHLYNQLGFVLVARTMSANQFYGGVFLIVVLMGGLYLLWLIILFGSQIAYACQNHAAYLQDRIAENVNQRGREFVALRIMTTLGRRFQLGLRPATVPELAAELAVPSRLTQSILRILAATRLVTEAAGPEAAFLPARPLESINAHDILIAMRTGGGQELPLADQPELAEMYGEFARIEQAERAAASIVTLSALANRRPAPALVAPLPPLSAPTPEPLATHAPPAPEIPTEPGAAPPASPAPAAVENLAPTSPENEKPSSKASLEAPPRREPARPAEHTDFPL